MGAAVLRSPALSWPGVAARTGRTRLCLVFRVPGSELQHHCRNAFPLDWSGAVVPGGGKDACQGDSGGPLVVTTGDGETPGQNYYQVAVSK